MAHQRHIADHRLVQLLWKCILLAASLMMLNIPAHSAPPLSAPHAALDTKDRCNDCHEMFEGVPRTKCLNCHTQIRQRISRGSGYHGRAVGMTPCQNCHREHLGRSHNMLGLNKRTFNHTLTGWPIQGGHVGVGCRECHRNTRPTTGRPSYLGTSPACNSCHGDFHGETKKTSLDRCDRCHNVFDWAKLNSKLDFNHTKETSFRLDGKHAQINCAKCHQGKQKFGPIHVAGCESCHQDPHPQGIFGTLKCDDCHVTQSFVGRMDFNHSKTGWPLTGKHQNALCLDCHSWQKWEPDSNRCDSCHQDAHRGQFRGYDCSRCHQTKGFEYKYLKFNHNTMSRFPLEGKHRNTACSQCHSGGNYKPIDPACRTCHADENPHGETFGKDPCSNCHSPISWQKTHFDHSRTGFALEGQHLEQSCYRCHPNGTELEDDTKSDCGYCHTDVHSQQFKETGCDDCHKAFEFWKIPVFDHSRSQFKLSGRHELVPCAGCHKDGHYRPIDTTCSNCHYNFHEGQFSRACEACHTSAGWSPVVNFDHQKQTKYPLEGRHSETECAKCHVSNQYTGTPQTCEECHVDIHKGKKGTDCARCHTADSWAVNVGQQHDFGAFRIEGAHDEIACERCHGPEREQTLVGRGPECVNCHRDPHFGSFGPACNDCHTQSYFLPSTFLHNQTGFRLSGAHRFVECRDCHPNRVYGGLPNQCDFCHTDTFMATSGSPVCDHTVCIPGALDGCHNCHTTRAWSPARVGTGCGVCETP